MRTPALEQTRHRIVAWAAAGLALILVLHVGTIGALNAVPEVMSEEVPAQSQLEDAVAATLLLSLLSTLVLGALLARWGGLWWEYAVVVPALVVTPYLWVALLVTVQWAGTGLDLADGGETAWTAVLLAGATRLVVLGLAVLLVGWAAGRLGAGPVALGLLAIAAAQVRHDPTEGAVQAGEPNYPLWLVLRAVLTGESQSHVGISGRPCSLVEQWFCRGEVTPVAGGAHLVAALAVLALLAVVVSASTRLADGARRRL